MTHTLNNMRLVKVQIATKSHECSECTEPIAKGERYNRVALPAAASMFPSPDVPMDEAWQYVDREWTIEKTHELCYTRRYFRPAPGVASCGHKTYGGSGQYCAEITCSNYVAKSKDWVNRGGLFSE